MNIDLGFTETGEMAVLTDSHFPAQVKRIEYYREQKLLMFIYDITDHEGDLMHFELHDDIAKQLERAAELRVLVANGNGGVSEDYHAPLIKIGI